MSEEEFLRLFRQEAGTLLSIPDHPNIAGFVTFDARAKPKPILVMELVDGVTCERLIASQSLTMPRALEILDGVLAGLEAMHAAGIAHLDVKPSNAILRDADDQPVLVDFGLAGRKLRPGCATLCYGAPEIWDETAAVNSPATLADVYSFGCFAYELLTAQTLFDGPSELAVISAHISHDGLPPPIQQMAQKRELQPLAMTLFRCLRNDPLERAPVSTLRREIAQLGEQIRDLSWPIRPW
jgi:serine/threonine protein kinase